MRIQRILDSKVRSLLGNGKAPEPFLRRVTLQQLVHQVLKVNARCIRYVTMTVPFSFFSAMNENILGQCPVEKKLPIAYKM